MVDTGRLAPIEGPAYQYNRIEGSANKGHDGEDPEDLSDSSDVCLNLELAFELQQQEEHIFHQAKEEQQQRLGHHEVNTGSSHEFSLKYNGQQLNKHNVLYQG
ncbi:hypothetical protein MHU86_15155 [Fragilaria crotonensis]|nr:hypothetical protein MHU86_24044 [Fragilaria crotonensis]KAI2499311.1 hypothetical protein MHU86_15155 [Fragilaria crotonensis]